MSYEIEIIRKDEYKTSTWSGGTTTELLIYPKDSLYNERNFKWRLSSAKVEVEESVFTHLPRTWRIIMIVEGNLRLEHEGHHNVLLKEFDKDSFSGEWITKSYGKVTDFNLMLNGGSKGNLETIFLSKSESKEVLVHSLYDNIHSKTTDVFYCVSGETKIFMDSGKKFKLNEGDLLAVTRTVKELPILLKFLNTGEEKNKIIRANIYY